VGPHPAELLSIPHPRVVNSAVWSPLTGRTIMTTCQVSRPAHSSSKTSCKPLTGSLSQPAITPCVVPHSDTEGPGVKDSAYLARIGVI
jgi:hypothetical protein